MSTVVKTHNWRMLHVVSCICCICSVWKKHGSLQWKTCTHICVKNTFCSVHSIGANLLLWHSKVWEMAMIWKSLTHGKETKHCSSQPWWRLLMHYCNYGTVGKCGGGKYQRPFQGEKKQISGGGCVSANIISKHQDTKLKCCADTCLKACSSGGIGCSFYCCNLVTKLIFDLIAMPGIHFKDKMIYTC